MNLDIFEKSRELGELLVASDEYKKVQQAEEEFNSDEFAQKKVAEFNELQQSVQNMMQ
ncbi:MAG: YlbF family regulator, partial [Candidatus Spyradocola sp.]